LQTKTQVELTTIQQATYSTHLKKRKKTYKKRDLKKPNNPPSAQPTIAAKRRGLERGRPARRCV
jgi:hypothetical protein